MNTTQEQRAAKQSVIERAMSYTRSQLYNAYEWLRKQATATSAAVDDVYFAGIVFDTWTMLTVVHGLAVSYHRALQRYEQAFEAMFAQAYCNGIFDAWGKPIDCTVLNQAHNMASHALAQDTSNVVAAPIPMILFCPMCGMQHIDAPEPNNNHPDESPECAPSRWQNPPHRSHLCHECGCIWRPADVATVGVEKIQTRGKDDTWPKSKEDA